MIQEYYNFDKLNINTTKIIHILFAKNKDNLAKTLSVEIGIIQLALSIQVNKFQILKIQ